MKSNKKKASNESLNKKEQNKNLETSTMELKISEDGRAIVNSDGKEIARFSEEVVMRLTKGTNKLPGHMVCEPECVLWDNKDGKCLKYIQVCHWEFPPFDF